MTRYALFFFFLVAPAALNARIVELRAEFVYINNSSYEIGPVYHRITLPPETPYQQLLSVVTDASEHHIRRYKDFDARYIAVTLMVAPHGRTRKEVVMRLRLESDQFELPPVENYAFDSFLAPYLETAESRQLKAIAELMNRSGTTLKERIEAAYVFVPEYLRFEQQNRAKGALEALRSGKGDCTEYADLFVALCRSMDIPARTVALFTFGHDRTVTMPNHNAAEIYLPGTGWVIVDPNLGAGRFGPPDGLGYVSDAKVLFAREGVPVWSNYVPDPDFKHAREGWSVSMRWHLRMLEE